MKKDKCMYCKKELEHFGYPICDDCWKERLTKEDRDKVFPRGEFERKLKEIKE
jgi:hypothetical protein